MEWSWVPYRGKNGSSFRPSSLEGITKGSQRSTQFMFELVNRKEGIDSSSIKNFWRGGE